MVSVAESNRAEVALAVRELIAAIKEVEGGAGAVPDNAVLFSDGGEPSDFEFDSLDALDLALGLQERFDPEGERFQTFLNGDIDPADLATVDRVVTYVMSVMDGSEEDADAAHAAQTVQV
jgi:acyl carrier protein